MRLPLLIDVGALTSFETAQYGSTICLGMRDTRGQEVGIVLPVECLNSLMMTSPRMLAQAAQRLHNDPKLRIVYPVGQFAVEVGDDLVSRIVNLGTPDGFSVSFVLSPDQCRGIGGSNADAVADDLRQRRHLN